MILQIRLYEKYLAIHGHAVFQKKKILKLGQPCCFRTRIDIYIKSGLHVSDLNLPCKSLDQRCFLQKVPKNRNTAPVSV